MPCAVDDLVEDVVVWLSAPRPPATDTTGGGAALAAGFLGAWSGRSAVVDAVLAGSAPAETVLAGPGAGR